MHKFDTPQDISHSPRRKRIAAAIIAAVAIGFVAMKTGILPFGASGPTSIVGTWQDQKGGIAEFLNDGTAIFTSARGQGVWKWATYDGNRLRLEPTTGLFGASSAVCNYQLTWTSLNVTGCDYAMQLSRN